MIWFIITDAENKYRENLASYKNKITLEKYAKDHCLVLHYKKVSLKLLNEHKPWAVCHSGGGTLYSKYNVLNHRNYGSVIKSDVPQIGFCRGHQVIASYHGSTIGPMRKLRSDDPDLSSRYNPGFFKENGIFPIQILKRDPLFKGLKSPMMMPEAHFWEVKKLSPDLKLLAKSKNCPVQSYVHKKKPVYGVQFHPESADDHYSDGFKLLENFFSIARAYGK